MSLVFLINIALKFELDSCKRSWLLKSFWIVDRELFWGLVCWEIVCVCVFEWVEKVSSPEKIGKFSPLRHRKVLTSVQLGFHVFIFRYFLIFIIILYSRDSWVTSTNIEIQPFFIIKDYKLTTKQKYEQSRVLDFIFFNYM